MATASSRVRHNYHPECEAAVNSHIQMLLYASYVALSMAFYFDQDDVALKGFACYFLKRSWIERERSEKLLKMQNQRGGRIVFQDIEKPERNDWEGGLQAMEAAFDLAKSINQSLLDVHDVATNRGDAHLCHFLETNYLDQQVQDIKELGSYLTSLRKMGTQNRGMTEYLFDRLTLGPDKKEN
ncbi:ferritin heavy chain [Oryctolagus cuniculus]|uniref:Ferritin n=1 Tax=Oryctolagus cuniculus TaxID=9986 RepID=G1TKN1_RABIT|nr:ferritin heavy chain [Oryctolagus cuniculus]